MKVKTRLFRSVYGGGPKGGSWSEVAKLNTVKRLFRMIVRVVFGAKKMPEYDAMVTRLDAMTPEEREVDLRRAKNELRAMLDRDES